MIFNEFFKGINRSTIEESGFDNLVNVDVHSTIGEAQCQLAEVVDATSGVPTEPCVNAIAPSGTIYLFSTTTTKIWKLNTNGTYASVTANANSGHRGAEYHNGYIYYWTATKAGRFVPDTEGSRNDNAGTAANGDFRASCKENLQLWITDGKYVASFDATNAFGANTLDFPPECLGTAIIPDGNTNILVGTRIGASVQSCRCFLWDTFSSSFTLSDPIPEIGVNTFINCDDMILAQCGLAGKLYYWTGSQLSLFDKEIRNTTTSLGHQLSTVFNSRPLLAVGAKIYSVYRNLAGLDRAIVQEYTCSNTIQSLAVSGSQLIVSHANGVNKLSSNRDTAIIETPEVQGNTNEVEVLYTDMPAGTSIDIYTKSNRGSYVQQTAITDTINRKVYFDGSLLDSIQTQAKVVMTPNGSATPKIISIELK